MSAACSAWRRRHTHHHRRQRDRPGARQHRHAHSGHPRRPGTHGERADRQHRLHRTGRRRLAQRPDRAIGHAVLELLVRRDQHFRRHRHAADHDRADGTVDPLSSRGWWVLMVRPRNAQSRKGLGVFVSAAQAMPALAGRPLVLQARGRCGLVGLHLNGFGLDGLYRRLQVVGGGLSVGLNVLGLNVLDLNCLTSTSSTSTVSTSPDSASTASTSTASSTSTSPRHPRPQPCSCPARVASLLRLVRLGLGRLRRGGRLLGDEGQPERQQGQDRDGPRGPVDGEQPRAGLGGRQPDLGDRGEHDQHTGDDVQHPRPRPQSQGQFGNRRVLFDRPLQDQRHRHRARGDRESRDDASDRGERAGMSPVSTHHRGRTNTANSAKPSRESPRWVALAARRPITLLDSWSGVRPGGTPSHPGQVRRIGDLNP